MPPSESVDQTAIRTSFDWRGWIVLAWVVWFGLLYGKMVVESRGHRLRELAPSLRNSR